MKHWRRFGLLALIGLLVSWLISCGSGSPGGSPGGSPIAAGTAEIEFWTMQLQPQFTDYFQKLIANFEQANPGFKVRWVDVPWTAMESKILTAVSAKTAPDVVNLNPDFASQLAARNAWLILDGKIPAAVRQQYLPKIWQANTLEGKSFGVPWYLTTRITIFNQDLLKQAGLPQPPTTFAELAIAAKTIREKTGKYAFFATFVPEDSADVLQSFIQMGATLVDSNGKAAFNTAEGRAVFQFWTDLYKNGLLPPEALTQGHRRAIELYQAGETAILVSGPEFLRTVQTNAPTIGQVSGVAPQITEITGKKNVAVMNLAIPRDSDQPDGAIKFALFVTNNENQLAFAKVANVLPSTQAALTDPYFQSDASPSSALEQARVISARQMQDAEVLIPAMKNLKPLQKIVYTELQAAMLGQKTVDQAIADAANAWNSR